MVKGALNSAMSRRNIHFQVVELKINTLALIMGLGTFFLRRWNLHRILFFFRCELRWFEWLQFFFTLHSNLMYLRNNVLLR